VASAPSCLRHAADGAHRRGSQTRAVQGTGHATRRGPLLRSPGRPTLDS
jgi:hypothetical protein